MGFLPLDKRTHPAFKNLISKPIIPVEIDRSNPISRGIHQSITNFTEDNNGLPITINGNLALTGDKNQISDGNQNYTDLDTDVLDGDFSFSIRLTFDFASATKVVLSNLGGGDFFWLGGTGTTFRLTSDAGDITSSSVNRNETYTVGYTRKGSVNELWVNGVSQGTLSEPLSPSGSVLTLAKFGTNASFNWIGTIFHCHSWSRALDASEMKLMHEMPYQILKPKEPWGYFLDSGGGGGGGGDLLLTNRSIANYQGIRQ